MNKSLFHINQEYLQLAEILEDNGGELTEEIEKQLTINKSELEVKGVNYAYVIKKMLYDAELCDKEIDRLTKLRKSKQGTVDRLKNSILNAMNIYGITKIEGETIKISLRNNASTLSISDEKLIPRKFMVKKVEVLPDKKAIKEALNNGAKVKGVELKESKSLLIK